MPDTPLSSWWSHVQESLLSTAQQFKERKAKPGSRQRPLSRWFTPKFPAPTLPPNITFSIHTNRDPNICKTRNKLLDEQKQFFETQQLYQLQETFSFSKKNPATGFLHFCNRSQSHSWSLVSSRGHFNEALLPWRKKVLHWSSDRMWSNLCTGLWNALHLAVATSFVHFFYKSIYSYAHFVFVRTRTYCALKEELHESICVEGRE